MSLRRRITLSYIPVHSFWLFSRLQSCLSHSERQSECNLVEGMTVLPTVAAIAARLAPRLCPQAVYVILQGMCVFCGYFLVLQRPRFRWLVCAHMVLPLNVFWALFVENVVDLNRGDLLLLCATKVHLERKFLSPILTVSSVRWLYHVQETFY